MPHILNDREQLCQYYLNHIFKNMRGHGTDMAGKKIIAQSYGEILYPSIAKLLSIIPLHADDVFVDAGSGLGKLALQIFLTSPVKAVYGIEIVARLHQQAILAEQKLREDLLECYQNERELKFILGNFLDLPLTNTTVLFLGSPCFSPSMLDTLSIKIENILSIHTVLTLRPLNLLQRLKFKKILRLEASWDTTLCYVYSN